MILFFHHLVTLLNKVNNKHRCLGKNKFNNDVTVSTIYRGKKNRATSETTAKTEVSVGGQTTTEAKRNNNEIIQVWNTFWQQPPKSKCFMFHMDFLFNPHHNLVQSWECGTRDVLLSLQHFLLSEQWHETFVYLQALTTINPPFPPLKVTQIESLLAVGMVDLCLKQGQSRIQDDFPIACGQVCVYEINDLCCWVRERGNVTG